MGSTQQQESITTMLVIDELKTENERIKNSLDETQKHLIDLEQKHKNELDSMQQQITKSNMEKNELLKAETMNNEKLKQLSERLNNYKNQMVDIMAQNKTLKAGQTMLRKKTKQQTDELNKFKQKVYQSQDDEKEKPSTFKEEKLKKKFNLNNIEHQIEIIQSESAWTKSLLLCVKPQYIQETDSKRINFSFLHFLKTCLNEKVIAQLFEKFKSESVDSKQLVSLLTLAVIIYNVKLHKLKTGTSEHPKMDSAKIRASVLHLSAWIIRTFGKKQKMKKVVCVQDDDGNKIKGEYDLIEANFSKSSF